jgi:hypothetical protein
MIDDEFYYQALCLVCDDYVVDMETNEIFYALKRDKTGRLKKEEFDKIELNKEYAMFVEKIDLSKYEDKIGLIARLKAIRARCAFKNKQKSLGQRESKNKK